MIKGSILKKLLLIGTTVAVAGSLIGTTLVASAQNSTSTPQSNTPTPAPTVAPTAVPATPRPDRDDLHPRWWARIFRQAARGDFDKFTGAELRYTDGANRLVVGGHPGTVARIGDNELMIKPNGGGDPVIYTFRPDTDAHLEEFRKHFRNIDIGDKVIIITLNGVAKWVIVVNERNDDGRKVEDRDEKRIEKERENAEKRTEKEKERAEKAREHEAKKAAQLKEREAKLKELEAKKTEQAKEREAKVKELQEKAKQRAEEARKKAEERRDNRGNATSTTVSNSNRT